MIDARVAEGLLDRLSGLNWFPRDNDQAQQDLAEALMTARNDIIATYVVNEWVRTQREAPKPADLREMIWNENHEREQEDARDAPAPRVHCPTCRDTGIVESLGADNLASVASWCRCQAARQREARSCPEGQCRDIRATKPVDEPMRGCCCPPWRVNQARAKIFGPQRPNIATLVRQISRDDYHGDF